MRIQRGMRGFTLIELAIVLVIIGLIIGAILKGGELIQSAKYKRLKMDWDSVLTAVYTYQDKYNALPGDDLEATTMARWGIGGGDADGTIETGGSLLECDGTAGPSNMETCKAWWHLRSAELLPGAEAVAPKHSFGSWITLGQTTNLQFGNNWDNAWAVCHEGLQNKVSQWLDEHYDDGDYSKGTIRGNADYTTTSGDAYTAKWTCIRGG